MATTETQPTPTPGRRTRDREPMGLRNIRTSNEMWTDFGELCDHDGSDLSRELRAYMAKRLATARRRGWKSSRES